MLLSTRCSLKAGFMCWPSFPQLLNMLEAGDAVCTQMWGADTVIL